MRRIAVQNLKGGTAKTTTAVSLAHALALRGRRVLLLDADAQGNVAACLGLKAHGPSIYHLLVEEAASARCIAPTGREGLEVLPSDKSLAAAEILFQSMPRREEVLSLRLRGLSGYDYVIVDCAPALSLLHQNALLFADELVIPISAEFLALRGAQQILDSMKLLRRYFDRVPSLLGVLPTLVDSRTSIANEIVAAIRDTYRDLCPVLDPIPTDTRVSQ